MMKHTITRMLMFTVLTCSVNILVAQGKLGGDEVKNDDSKTVVKDNSKDSKPSLDNSKKVSSGPDKLSSDADVKNEGPKSFFGKLFGKNTKSAASAKSTSSGKSAPGSSSAKKGGKTKGKTSDAPSVGGGEKGEESKDEHRQDKDDGGR